LGGSNARLKWKVTFVTQLFILGEALIESLASFASPRPKANPRLLR
jgi:hypothetical protein